ncbi:sensor histidine kinase [Sphingomonas adhaesiva]|uniref:sensor histidine kinase n=1 Tax=Sphingomonas adhaesiva TaxID=28212 RepID=UPI002FF769F9
MIGSVVAATAILFFVTFSGPPPMAPPRPLEAITAALTGRPQPPYHPRRHREEEPVAPLIVTRAAALPTPRSREQADPGTRARIAALLGTDVARVVAYTELRPRFGGRDLFGSFTVGWAAPDGWRVVHSPPRPRFTRWHARTLAAMLIAILALSLPAWALARAITRPLARLADAADRAGTGAPLPALPEGGREVRELAQAVATMHARLAGHAESRTAMLGAIAHDLGTPLSRLAFWVEQLPDAARDRAVADIDEMRAMIAQTLRFAREDAGALDDTLVELSSLLDALAQDMALGGEAIGVTPGPRVVVRGDPGELRRLFANLIGNALRYGESAMLSWRVEGARVVVTVADRGPGIDPAQAERLFDPFVRGDPSRNRATGGSGLGLAIVRSIAGRHGGTATLANRADGAGAEALVTFPVAR